MKDLNFFKKAKKLLPAVSYDEIFQRITFSELKKFRFVVKENDVGRKFFIILKGEVHVLAKQIRSEVLLRDED